MNHLRGRRNLIINKSPQNRWFFFYPHVLPFFGLFNNDPGADYFSLSVLKDYCSNFRFKYIVKKTRKCVVHASFQPTNSNIHFEYKLIFPNGKEKVLVLISKITKYIFLSEFYFYKFIITEMGKPERRFFCLNKN